MHVLESVLRYIISLFFFFLCFVSDVIIGDRGIPFFVCLYVYYLL